MNGSDFQTHVLAVLNEAKAPITLTAIVDAVKLRIGERVDPRKVDRALQVLRKRKVVSYAKTSGEKGSHGWSAVGQVTP